MNSNRFKYFSRYVDTDVKSRDAALVFNRFRGNHQRSGVTIEKSNLKVVRLSEVDSLKNKADYEFICKRSRKPIDTPASELDDCIYDATAPTGVYVRSSSTAHEFDNLRHAFTALSEYFGRYGDIEDVFRLFGKFEAKKRNVLFGDDASQLIPTEDN